MLGWLTRLVLSLSLLGLVGFDGIAVAQAHFVAADHASSAASAAAETWQSSHDLQRSYEAALAAVTAGEDTIDTASFRVAADGSVHLILHRTASTLWLWRISALKHVARVSAEGSGTPPS